MIPYPSYKSTNLPWLPKIPEHWTVNKVRHFYHSILGKMLASSQTDSTYTYEKYLCAKDVHFSGVDLSDLKEMWFSPEEKKKYQISAGDLLVVEGGAGAGGAAIFKGFGESLYIQNSIHRVRPKTDNVTVQFLYYWLCAFVRRKYVDYACNKATIPHFTGDKLSEMPFVLAPLAEQEQIVRYLDAMTAKINKLIRAKKKQIALLQEQRQAIINRAVTRCLAPNAEMKDSCIDWIGEIPKDWRMPHLSFLTTKIGSGKTPRGGAETYQESGVRFIRSQNVYFNSLVTDNLQYISESIDATMPSTRVLKDDVLLNITGASIGRCCVYRSELRANVNQHVCIIRCRKDLILPDYLASVLFSRVGQEAISHCQNEGNRESLTFPQIGAFFIPLPSIEEQQQILDFVAERVKPIEDVIENINKEIDTLNEYRNSLISSVVTGQTDVRNIIVDHVEQNELTTEFDNMSNDLDNPIQESEETNDYWN